jgi:hypothetical protein
MPAKSLQQKTRTATGELRKPHQVWADHASNFYRFLRSWLSSKQAGFGVLILVQRKDDTNGRAVTGPRFEFKFAMMGFDNPFDNGQAQPGAFAFRGL